jgi:branched-chain amino acid transport system substrate-binding protein
MSTENSANKLWRRRDLIKLLGATALTGPTILRGTTADAATSKVIKIGHVSSQTGVFAPFAEADPFTLNQIRNALAKGITNGGVTYQVQIISKDSQSNSNRASEVASDLILRDGVDLLITSGAPETTNAVADQAEANEVPCIASLAAWQPYFFGRHGTPDKGFTWTYHFCFGIEDIIVLT